jgi:O-acetyl-ADP-ribose deacetylase (regulator of RNase III)
MRAVINDITVELLKGDITDLAYDAIVNPASSELILALGIGGAIARKGGPTIQSECLEIGWCAVGNAVITGGGLLSARYVIHAVGPIMGEGTERGKLSGATRSSLLLAERHGLQSIALPPISTGVFGFPLEGCAQVMLRVIVDFTFEDLLSLRRIAMCLEGEKSYQIFADELGKHLNELGIVPEMFD